MENKLLNDLAILGLPVTKKVFYGDHNRQQGIVDIIGTDLNEKEVDELRKVFRHSIKTRKLGIAATNGMIEEVVFFFSPTTAMDPVISICSSSKDELWEMFKADHTKQTIPMRKCFLSWYKP